MIVELLCGFHCGGPGGIKIGERVGSPLIVVVALDPIGGGVGGPAPFPLRRRRNLKDWAEGSILDSCNLTGHITRKSGDSVHDVEKCAICT